MYTVEQARRLANLTMDDMASRLGMSRATYNYKEKGKRRFYYDEAVKFAEIVGLPLDTIKFC